MYCIVILYCWVLPGKYTSLIVAVLCSVLILTAVIINDKDEQMSGQIIGLNSLISVVAIWVTASLVLIAQKSLSQLEGHQEELENQVEIRTSELQKSESRLRHMIGDVAEYAIIMMDSDGHIENWNKGARDINGYDSEEVIGKSPRLFHTKRDQENFVFEKLIETAINEGNASQEGIRVRKNGTTFWAKTSITAILDKKGLLTGFSKVTHDLTAKRETEKIHETYSEQLAEKNKELEQFAYIVSHDLQEPLRTITGFANLLSKKHHDLFDEHAKASMNFILEATKRMSLLINGVLDFSRLGKSEEAVKINTNTLINDIVSDIGARIEDANAQIEIDVLPNIYGYQTQLRLLFQNLMSNGLKFQKEGATPQLKIQVNESSSHWTFSVADNGIGIKAVDLTKIFEIFQRLHSRETYEGTGIGLAHCKKIVESHDGKIWVESEVDKGSSFHFSISKDLMLG